MFDAVLRGAQSMTSFMFATLTDLVIRVALCFALDPVLGIEGIWWSWPIGWGISTCISVVLYYTGRWYKSPRARAKFAALAALYESEHPSDGATRTTRSRGGTDRGHHRRHIIHA